MAELDTVLVGGIAQVDGGLQDVGGLDAGDADQELIAQAMKEQVIAETRLSASHRLQKQSESGLHDTPTINVAARRAL